MRRTNILRTWLITGVLVAFVATPAMASDEYQSVNAITGAAKSADDRGYESVNAVTGPVSNQPSSPATGDGSYSSQNALVGADPTPISSIVEVEASGFDWSDALIGALFGTALMLLAFGGARLVGQSRRRTAELSA